MCQVISGRRGLGAGSGDGPKPWLDSALCIGKWRAPVPTQQCRGWEGVAGGAGVPLVFPQGFNQELRRAQGGALAMDGRGLGECLNPGV